ncbi:MAG: SPASM domain-containing protein [Desulfarculales bacterium]|jgi:MoaA/NifB/PqqE/SkfB family radical SAM enzyme|nr:SPASM domain-containing protein [Desulfarculales bacterium]
MLRYFCASQGYIAHQDFADASYMRKVNQLREGLKQVKDYTAPYPLNNMPLFNKLEIETVNRCNGQCAFCPVNRQEKQRPLARMSEELFYSVISQLRELNYAGNIQLFSNNEPFLDRRINTFIRHAKSALPLSFLQMMSNGTLLTLDKFKDCIGFLDSLIIDNYSADYEFHPHVKSIYEYCLQNEELQKKVKICKRTPDEVLHSRGGQSPNHEKVEVIGGSCIYPFNQMVIRPTGQASLCCNDALGEVTLGDVSRRHIAEVWNGPEYVAIREKILRGRQHIRQCSSCTNMLPFFVPPGHHVDEYIPDGHFLMTGKLRVLPSSSWGKKN